MHGADTPIMCQVCCGAQSGKEADLHAQLTPVTPQPDCRSVCKHSLSFSGQGPNVGSRWLVDRSSGRVRQGRARA